MYKKKERLIAINYGSLNCNLKNAWFGSAAFFWTAQTLESRPLLLHASGRRALSHAVAKASCAPLVFPCQLAPPRHAEPTETWASLSCGIMTEINTRASAEDWLNFRLVAPPTHGRHASVSVRAAVRQSCCVVVVVVVVELTTISSALSPGNWYHLHNACWPSQFICGRCTRLCIFPSCWWITAAHHPQSHFSFFFFFFSNLLWKYGSAAWQLRRMCSLWEPCLPSIPLHMQSLCCRTEHQRPPHASHPFIGPVVVVWAQLILTGAPAINSIDGVIKCLLC